MKVRPVVSFRAEPGKGDALAGLYRERCKEVVREPGCERFEVFQSTSDPDSFTLLELWSDPAALDQHAKVNQAHAPPAAGPARRRWRPARGLRPQPPALTARRAGPGRVHATRVHATRVHATAPLARRAAISSAA